MFFRPDLVLWNIDLWMCLISSFLYSEKEVTRKNSNNFYEKMMT